LEDATNVGPGMAGTAFERETDSKGISPRYTDGSTPRVDSLPNPRLVSNQLFDFKKDIPDPRAMTDFSVFWGQFLAHEISFSPTQPTEPMSITIPDGDSDLPAGSTIGLFRSTSIAGTGNSISNPRKSINGVSSFIDGSTVYGNSQARSNSIRAFDGLGSLLSSAGNLLPLDNGGPSFLAGDTRANENFALLALQTLFLREHNRLVKIIQNQSPMSDADAFQLARKIIGAELQAITYNEYLPAMGINLSAYKGFNAKLNPQGIAEVLTNGFRLGHTQNPPFRLLIDSNGNRELVPLLATFFNPAGFNEHIMDEILRGGAFLKAQKVDLQMIDDLRNISLMGGAVVLDLAAIDIQRARDRGILDYNTVRTAFKLKKVKNFKAITKDKAIQQKLQALYGNVNNIDLFAGMLAEDTVKGTASGPTINAMIKVQFERLRDGDKFFYRNDPAFKPGGFLASMGFGVAFFETRLLSDIVNDNSGVARGQIPLFVLRMMNKKEQYAAYNARVNAASAILKQQTKELEKLLKIYKRQRNIGGINFVQGQINSILASLNPYKQRLNSLPKK
jgi:hypothetical protein